MGNLPSSMADNLAYTSYEKKDESLRVLPCVLALAPRPRNNANSKSLPQLLRRQPWRVTSIAPLSNMNFNSLRFSRGESRAPEGAQQFAAVRNTDPTLNPPSYAHRLVATQI